MSAPSTPTARLLLRELQERADAEDDATTTDAPYIARQRAEARRDAIREVTARLRSALPVIEDEAIGGVDADIESLERSLGWTRQGAGVPA